MSCIEIANNCSVPKYWEWCDLCTAVRAEKLCVVHPWVPSKRVSDLVLFHWGGLSLKRQIQPHHITPAHPLWVEQGWDSLLAKNTMQGATVSLALWSQLGSQGPKVSVRTPSWGWMCISRWGSWETLCTQRCWLPSLHSCLIRSLQGVRFLWANLRRKAFLIRYLTDSEYVHFYIVTKIWLLSSLGRDFVFRDLFKVLSMLLVLQV